MADFEGWSVTITQDNMKASLYMEPPYGRDPYTVDETMEYLKANGVIGGVDYDTVERIVELRQYYKSVVVAVGKSPVDGVDGYYEFMFDISGIKTPAIRSDGSVDYSSMSEIQAVRRGDKLAVYHFPVKGTHGYDVKGRELRCRPGKPLAAIRGKGFEVTELEDTTEYYADKDGRISYNDLKMEISDLYEHKGDLDLVTSRIDFRGDVIIRGSVRSGTVIRASKSITVEGSVEAATLIAEGDITLKKGMQGGNKARIVCGGDLRANFIEFTDVSAKGNIEANVVLNSTVSAGKTIKISGRRGTIVGGTTYAVESLESANLGNQAEIKTIASVGVTEELERRNHMLKVKAESAGKSIRRAKAEIEMLLDPRMDDIPQEVKDAKISKLKRAIDRDERMLQRVLGELSETENTIVQGRNAVINISGKVFPGTTLQVCGRSMSIDAVETGKNFYTVEGSDKVQMKDI